MEYLESAILIAYGIRPTTRYFQSIENRTIEKRETCSVILLGHAFQTPKRLLVPFRLKRICMNLWPKNEEEILCR
jgi:hypothetical protein